MQYTNNPHSWVHCELPLTYIAMETMDFPPAEVLPYCSTNLTPLLFQKNDELTVSYISMDSHAGIATHLGTGITGVILLRNIQLSIQEEFMQLHPQSTANHQALPIHHQPTNLSHQYSSTGHPSNNTYTNMTTMSSANFRLTASSNSLLLEDDYQQQQYHSRQYQPSRSTPNSTGNSPTTQQNHQFLPTTNSITISTAAYNPPSHHYYPYQESPSFSLQQHQQPEQHHQLQLQQHQQYSGGGSHYHLDQQYFSRQQQINAPASVISSTSSLNTHRLYSTNVPMLNSSTSNHSTNVPMLNSSTSNHSTNVPMLNSSTSNHSTNVPMLNSSTSNHSIFSTTMHNTSSSNYISTPPSISVQTLNVSENGTTLPPPITTSNLVLVSYPTTGTATTISSDRSTTPTTNLSMFSPLQQFNSSNRGTPMIQSSVSSAALLEESLGILSRNGSSTSVGSANSGSKAGRKKRTKPRNKEVDLRYEMKRKELNIRGHGMNLVEAQKERFQEPYNAYLGYLITSFTKRFTSTNKCSFTPEALEIAKQRMNRYESSKVWRVWLKDDGWTKFSFVKYLSCESKITNAQMVEMLILYDDCKDDEEKLSKITREEPWKNEIEIPETNLPLSEIVSCWNNQAKAFDQVKLSALEQEFIDKVMADLVPAPPQSSIQNQPRVNSQPFLSQEQQQNIKYLERSQSHQHRHILSTVYSELHYNAESETSVNTAFQNSDFSLINSFGSNLPQPIITYPNRSGFSSIMPSSSQLTFITSPNSITSGGPRPGALSLARNDSDFYILSPGMENDFKNQNSKDAFHTSTTTNSVNTLSSPESGSKPERSAEASIRTLRRTSLHEESTFPSNCGSSVGGNRAGALSNVGGSSNSTSCAMNRLRRKRNNLFLSSSTSHAGLIPTSHHSTWNYPLKNENDNEFYKQNLKKLWNGIIEKSTDHIVLVSLIQEVYKANENNIIALQSLCEFIDEWMEEGLIEPKTLMNCLSHLIQNVPNYVPSNTIVNASDLDYHTTHSWDQFLNQLVHELCFFDSSHTLKFMTM